MATVPTLSPTTFEQAARALAAASAEGRTVRIAGAGTKRRWGNADLPFELELHTTGLDRILEHNAGDMTATVQAGVSLADAQRRFAQAGQMLALDPPGRQPDDAGEGRGADGSPTIGGIVATGDSGPLSHRYGGPRDLIVGATVALSDGTIARSGGTVIKNVAGYDIAKLLAGSFGTLGLILSVNLRLHPRPKQSATVLAAAGDDRALAAAALALSAAPAELDALDIASDARGRRLLARVSGPRARARAASVAELISATGLHAPQLVTDDDALWAAQRAAQRSAQNAVVRVSAAPTKLPVVLEAAAACQASVVGRAAHGLSYVTLDSGAIDELRRLLPAEAAAVVLDAPEGSMRASGEDPWGPVAPAALALMRRCKARFDPAGTCNPGLFVGGI